MIKIFSFFVAISLAQHASASAQSVICRDQTTGTVLEAERLEQPDFYGDTMSVKVYFTSRPTKYEKFHELPLKSGLTFKGAMATNHYVDHLELILGDQNSSTPESFPNAIMKLHEDIYHDNTDKWEEVRSENKMTCTVFPAPQIISPCSSLSQSQINHLLLQSALDKSTDGIAQAISCSADLNAVNDHACTPLMLASETNSFTCGAKSAATDSFLYWRSLSIFSTLLEEGSYAYQADHTGETVLHKIIRNGENQMLNLLIENEEDLNVQDHNGLTPLMLAAKLGTGKMVKMLVDANANTELKNSQGQNAYDLGERLDRDTRDLLLAAAVTIEIKGSSSGQCSPMSIEIPLGKAAKLKLTAASGKMFLLNVPIANVSLMAGGGQTVNKNFKIDRAGRYPFQCGIHGGSQSTGYITVK